MGKSRPPARKSVGLVDGWPDASGVVWQSPQIKRWRTRYSPRVALPPASPLSDASLGESDGASFVDVSPPGASFPASTGFVLLSLLLQLVGRNAAIVTIAAEPARRMDLR